MPRVPQQILYQLRALALSLLASLTTMTAPSFAANHIYTYSIKKQGDGELIHFYDHTAKRTVWTRKVHDHSFIGWAKDHQAILIGVTTLTFKPSILVWSHDRPPSIYDYGDDYMLSGIEWSADSKRVLFRTGFSGDVDVDLGSVRCLNLQTHRISSKSKGVREMAWADSRKVLYWEGSLEDSHVVIDKKPHLWLPP